MDSRARGGGDNLTLVPTGRRPRSLPRKPNRRHPVGLQSRTSWADTPPRRGPLSLFPYRRYRCEPQHPPHHPPSAVCLLPRVLPALCSPLDPITARPSPIGDGSRSERGPHHTGLLVSRCHHRGTQPPGDARLNAAAAPHNLNTPRELGCASRCYLAVVSAQRMNHTSLPLPTFKRGQNYWGSHTPAASRGNPTRGDSSCTRPFPFEPFTATGGTPPFQTVIRTSFT